MSKSRNKKAFTLIEVLVVISIVSLLSSITIVALAGSREKAKIAKAQSELLQLRNAVGIMTSDTKVWPDACPPGIIFSNLYGNSSGFNNEIALDDSADAGAGNQTLRTGGIGAGILPHAGIYNRPDPNYVLYVAGPCGNGWANYVNAWNGPYTTIRPIDPWGNPYWFDNDYEAYCGAFDPDDPYNCTGCPNHPYKGTMAVLVSAGPNKQGQPFALKNNNDFDCDNVFIPLDDEFIRQVVF